MALMDIHDIFLNRKSNIMQMLKEQEGAIALDKKHELIGAMNEIDLVLKTLEYYNTNGKKDTDGINLLTNQEDERESLFSRVFRGRKD